jgi:hypothetical protein
MRYGFSPEEEIMRSHRMAAFIASVGLFAAAGCGAPSTQPSRTISGQVNLSDYRIGQPAVLVESSRRLSYVAALSSTGKFRLAVPSGQSYRLTLTNRTAGGQLELVSRILWTTHSKTIVWAKVSGGAPINFGLIRPVGTTSPVTPQAPGGGATGANSQGDNDDCDDNDDAQGDEQGQGDAGAACATPPPSNPPLCSPGPGSMSNSQGDQDDDVGEDTQDEGDDDRDGNCGDGGVKSGPTDDDNAQGNNNLQGQDDDEGDDDGMRCTVHIPPCPTGVDGGTNPPPPPPSSPDMSAPNPPPPPSRDMGVPIP